MAINQQSSHGYLIDGLALNQPAEQHPIMFEDVILPDGTRKGRRMARAVVGNAYAAFYPIGRKGQFWVTWGTMDDSRSGGEATDGRPAAEFRATEILRKLNQ